MKKTIFLFIILVSLAGHIIAKPVSIATARKAAENFYYQNKLIKPVSVTLTYTGTSPGNAPVYYVFNINEKDGFVIIAANDAVRPVIGYSTKGSFKIPEASTNINYWLSACANQINKVRINNIPASKNIAGEWSYYLNGNNAKNNFNLNKNITTVNALIQTQWDQDPFYNALCPGQSITGCVATAMAQIMKYWNFPPHGTDSSSYCDCTSQGYTDNYGILSANYGHTFYNWANMPVELYAPNNDVATLMYQCGVSVDMDYDPNGSGANVITADGPASAQSAFPAYFGYDPYLIKGLIKSDYADTAWTSLLKTELNNGRPVEYTGGDHCWVLDGYDQNNLFHMNWGWSGYDDGYFSLSNLVADGDNVTAYQEAIIGIRPSVLVATDAGITTIIAPSGTICGPTIQPEISLKNFGTDTLVSCIIYYKIDSGIAQTQNWNGSLATSQSANISLPVVSVSPGAHTLYCYTGNPNDSVDGDTLNDKAQISFFTQSGVMALPFSEGFENSATLPPGWSTYNPDNDVTWEVNDSVAHSGSHCIAFNNCDGDGNSSIEGKIDRLYLPAVNFSLPKEYLSFDVAYCPVNDQGYLYTDTLAVYYSTDCGTTWNNVYVKGGDVLATAPDTSDCWAPSSTQWRTDNINLSSLTGQTNVIIALENRSGWGDWLYLDNINIAASPAGIISHDEIPVNVIMFPNPTHDKLIIECEGFIPKTLSINSVQGEMIIQKIFYNSKIETDIHSLPKGVYFIKITGNEKTYFKKLIID